jgi:hypothetical protein
LILNLNATAWVIYQIDGKQFVKEPYATGRRKLPRMVWLDNQQDFIPYIEAEIKELETNPKYYDSIEQYNKGKFGGFGGQQYSTSLAYRNIYDRYLNPLKELLTELKEGKPFRELNLN